MKLLLATGNRGKVREITEMLRDLPIEIVSLREFPHVTPPVESGKSFAANARIKAETYFRQTGLVTLAEDSGLRVDYLRGQPGIFSARFARDGATDAENVRKLLRLLRGVKTGKRTAHFMCAVAIVDGKNLWTAVGKCKGRIAARASGRSGFGYDPIFIPKGYRTTFARLGEEAKNKISHRARALRKARAILERLLTE
ncbi:MAG: RdgB/HAM1 family non-canonical purine NTP pyrophosphatase [Candidatus Abyssobacteria bacterium SURF_17]|uniref:dITP/XTP pyrophosphatase n=1 Tax=Candidatus Abyssobacteria bacterium SURF_17 TaxID=2093361 RepID=A0A419ESV9_9BACT|nr:MAG: RdgB/HAM1 family non-canonical purine NTP pyrophosphatase [Candidatus Abyssubacteria bacterium SURF_17]